MLQLYILLYLAVIAAAQMKENIIDGREVTIEEYPHSVFVHVCGFQCGGSILNQILVLTAAHCVEVCLFVDGLITAFFGQSERQAKSSAVRTGIRWVTHDEYDINSLDENDIALIKLDKKIPLGGTMSRVAVMRHPPYHDQAWVAGWGRIADKQLSLNLKEIPIRPLVFSKCHQMSEDEDLHKGYICGVGWNPGDSVAKGDSGSAMVVRGYIQIGIAAFREIYNGTSFAGFTDVGYYYEWIRDTARDLNCDRIGIIN